MNASTHRASPIACAALSWIALGGCATAAQPAQPTQDVAIVIPPPPASTPEPIASAAPSAIPSAAPSAIPSAAPAPKAPIDRHTCRPFGSAVTFEVTDDDAVIALDVQGCPLGESHFKSNGYSYKASVELMTELQKRLKANDKNGLADLANYPLRVNFKKPLLINDRAAFLREFDKIYSPGVTEILLKQDPRDLFCNFQGVMLGRGIVWADNNNARKHVGVIAINPP